ncbi:MAG: hypothetical protein KGI69_00745 [Patescibacteria group bacterium]|nr:hypothetical protein [Patescibacteria group bacterium]
MNASSNNSAIASAVLRWALAFTVAWFGWSEIWSPGDWSVFVPAYLGLGQGDIALYAVIAHGTVLCSAGLALVLAYRVRFMAGLIAFMLLAIVADLILQSGLTDIAVRDIGLLGLALGIAVL